MKKTLFALLVFGILPLNIWAIDYPTPVPHDFKFKVCSIKDIKFGSTDPKVQVIKYVIVGSLDGSSDSGKVARISELFSNRADAEKKLVELKKAGTCQN